MGPTSSRDTVTKIGKERFLGIQGGVVLGDLRSTSITQNYPPASKASREVANLTERKIHKDDLNTCHQFLSFQLPPYSKEVLSLSLSLNTL